jgi:type II secretory pathway component PulM
MQLKPIFDRLSKYTDKYQPQIDSFILRLKPIKDYWLRLSGRDQQVLMIAGSIIALMFVVLIISSAIGIKNSLKINYTTIAEQRIDAQIIAQQYKDLSQTTPNDFSSVNSDRIKGDATQILDVKDAEIIFSDNTLSVKVGNAKFEKVMQFLDQLRKSYGLFPNTLTITRLSQPGYVALNVSFNNVEQQ